MTVDMKARRDAFLMITDEKPPAKPKRWLVVWTWKIPLESWTEWSAFDSEDEALECVRRLGAPAAPASVYDLDAQ